MGMTPEKRQELDQLCLKFRKILIETLHGIQTGHPGGSLSSMEILTDLFFNEANIGPDNIASPDRDKIILCKGHAAPALYMNLAEKGFFPVEEMKTLRQINSRLQGHPCSKDTPGVEVSSGPLGAGYPVALGIALADCMDGRDSYTYAILGDGEIQEGVVWEAAENANKYKADHLITIVDWNGVQLDGTNDEIMPLGDLQGKGKAFGYNVIECDGHDVASISDAIAAAKQVKGQPTVILAHTVKGKGVSFMEGKSAWHGKAIDDASYEQAMKELGGAQ